MLIAICTILCPPSHPSPGTDTTILKSFITQQGRKLESAAPKPPATLTNAVSWRNEGIKHRKNEVLFPSLVPGASLRATTFSGPRGTVAIPKLTLGPTPAPSPSTVLPLLGVPGCGGERKLPGQRQRYGAAVRDCGRGQDAGVLDRHARAPAWYVTFLAHFPAFWLL